MGAKGAVWAGRVWSEQHSKDSFLKKLVETSANLDKCLTAILNFNFYVTKKK